LSNSPAALLPVVCGLGTNVLMPACSQSKDLLAFVVTAIGKHRLVLLTDGPEDLRCH
jgi:hypothetical protein